MSITSAKVRSQNNSISQAKVSRLLKRALDDGIVRITVSAPLGCHTALETAIQELYGLKDVIVVDAAPDDEKLLRNLGAAAAFYLETTIRDGEVIGISSWSETLLATANAMQPLPASIRAHVVQILGDRQSDRRDARRAAHTTSC